MLPAPGWGLALGTWHSPLVLVEVQQVDVLVNLALHINLGAPVHKEVAANQGGG